MFVPKHMEFNPSPSKLNTSAKKEGVPSQLADVLDGSNKPKFDGVTIQQMRDNPIYQKIPDIDKVGLAQKKIAESAKIVKSKSKFIRALNESAQRISKPKNK